MKIENAGKKVNSKYSEYSPYLVNGSELYFTGIQADDVIVVDEADEDFHSKAFVSRKNDKGEWQEASPLNTNVNREGFHVSNLSFSPDGSRMYYTRATLDGSELAESKVYYSDKGGDGWGPAQELDGVNGDYAVRQPVVGELFGTEVLE